MMCLFFLIFAGMNKINKDRYLCLILWSSFILLGCKNYSIEKKLSTVDTLLAADNLNEAEFTLRQISEKDMSESELAKYNLLSILTTWRLSQPIKNETDLDKSISYLEQNGNDALLARCYYMKGELLCDKGQVEKGIIFYKRAEQLVAKDDLITQHHIYESIAFQNMCSEALGIAIQYAQKALRIANQLHKPDWVGYEYYLLTLSFNGLGKTKEAQLTIQRLLKLLPKMSEKGQMDILDILGQYYQLRNPELMEQLMHKAMSNQSNITPYLYMAAHRYNQGKKEEAYLLLDKAEKQCNGKHCYALIEGKRDMKLQDKDYKSANQLSMQLLHLEDSMSEADNRKDLETAQNNFEQQLREQRQQRVYAYILLAIIALILSVAILLIYLRYRVQKMRSILTDDRLKIATLNKQIVEAKQSLANTEFSRDKQKLKIERLEQEVTKIEERHNGFLAVGHQCYDSILNGKTTVTWKKYDFQAFIEYYKIIDANYLNELEEEYNSLTYKNEFIFILQHLGLSKAMIAKILGISEGAIRTALSRTKKRNKKT